MRTSLADGLCHIQYDIDIHAAATSKPARDIEYYNNGVGNTSQKMTTKTRTHYINCPECGLKKSVAMKNLWWTGTEYNSAGDCKHCGKLILSTTRYKHKGQYEPDIRFSTKGVKLNIPS